MLRPGPLGPTTGSLEPRVGGPRPLRRARLENEALAAPQSPVPNRGRHLATPDPCNDSTPAKQGSTPITNPREEVKSPSLAAMSGEATIHLFAANLT